MTNNPPIPPAGQWVIDQQAEITRLRAELETERRKVDAAKAAISDAPHEAGCRIYSSFSANPADWKSCDCWKSSALAALTPSEKGEE